MKKLFLSLVMLAIAGLGANAQTYVSGGIYSNTTWTLAGSPYIVTDTVVVFPGVTLTIQPGVVVKFDNNMRLEIRQATIIAQGTLSDSITFTSNSSSPLIGIWGGIDLNDGTSTCYFQYCNILYANMGLSDDYSYSTRNVEISNSNFKYCNIGIFGGSLDVNYFIRLSNFLYNLTGIEIYNSSGSTDKCKINFNQTGIIVYTNQTIKNCIVDSNSLRGLYLYTNMSDSVISNEFFGNNIGIYINFMCVNYTNTITQNIIENNNIGIKTLYWNNKIYCNKICNNASYDLYDSIVGSYNISLANNYWCTTDSATIRSTIYDGYDNINLSLVHFLPVDSIGCYLNGCLLSLNATVTNATCDTCHNGSATGNVSNGIPPYTWTWYTSPMQTTQTATGLALGTYTLCVTDSRGCSTCNNSIFIDSTNCTGFAISTSAHNATCSACSDGYASVTVYGGTPPYHYTWYTIPMQTTATATGLTHGTYHVCVTDLYGCTACDSAVIGTGSCSAYFYLYPDTTTPHKYYAVNMASGIPPLSYYWSWGDRTHDTIPYPSHTYATAGYYTISLSITDSAGCNNTYSNSYYLLRSASTMIWVNVIPQGTTGINEIELSKQIKIYPNPSTNNLTIETPTQATIEITNIQGQLIETLSTTGNKTNIDVSSFAKGMYFVKVRTEKGVAVKKFIKE